MTVVDNIIFDSTQKRALKLKKESLDWICGSRNGCESIDQAVRFIGSWGMPKREVKKYKCKIEKGLWDDEDIDPCEEVECSNNYE